MLVSSTAQPVEIPHEPNNFFTIRQLSGLELDEAESVRSIKSMRRWGDIGKEALEALRSDNINNASQPPVQRKSRDDYDWTYIVTKAIVAWSGPNYDSIPCTDENKLQLDRQTLEWVVDYIVKDNVITEGESLTSVEL